MPAVEGRYPIKDAEAVLIAGIKCYVYGLNDIDSSHPIVLAVGLHPRTLDYKYIETIGADILANVKNVVIVTFDLPNHGARLSDIRANQDWKVGNPTHAQDLVSGIDLAAAEAGTIARYIPSYFPVLERAAASGDLIRVAFGASLGGHICWRIATGPDGPLGNNTFAGILPIIGCPFLGSMLQHRFSETSQDNVFPLSTMQNLEVSDDKSKKLVNYPGFRILALCGSEDKLVPPSYTEEWASQNSNTLQKVIIDEGTGHFASNAMRDQMVGWFQQISKANQRDTDIPLPQDQPEDAQQLSSQRPLDEDN